MIRHIVLMRLKDSVTAEEKQSLTSELGALRDHIPGVVAFHAGPNISVETEVVQGFNDLFWFDFDDEAARDAYLVHPRHQAVAARIVAHTKGGPDGIVVADIAF